MDKRENNCTSVLSIYRWLLRRSKTSKVNQINNKLSELNMDWYQWQDVEKIVNNESINGY